MDTAGWSEQNKAVTINFSLERADKQLFRGLRTEDVELKLNGSPVLLKPDALSKGRDARILFMVDTSGSMVDTREGGGVDKLRAARDALRHIVGQLGEKDQAAIVAFDEEQTELVRLTPRSKRSDLERGIDAIETRQKNTKLYDSIRWALDKAKREGIGIVIFISDGMEDTKDAQTALAEGRLVSYKRGEEQKLSKLARESGIRMFSVAVGEPGNLEMRKGVDFDSLKAISEVTNGGFARLVNPSDLKSAGSPAKMNERLTEKLKDVLEATRKDWSFDHALKAALPEMQEGQGELQVNLSADQGDKRVTVPVVYSYTWDKSIGPPIFSPGRVLTPLFIDIKPPVDWPGLTQVYLLLLSPLVLLGLIPSVLNRIAGAREMSRMSNAIEQLGHGSPWLNKLCPNEMGSGTQRFLFKPGDTVLVCPKCQTPHHLSCWEYNQHQCMNRVCEYQFVIPPRVLARHGIASVETKRHYV
ncbi:MAG: VWA domain-containing protein [Pyrinomonadaceae bacterium]